MSSVQTCPRCGQVVDEVAWKLTVLRSNVSEEGTIGAAPFDTLLAVPPGRFTLLPCGHDVDPEVGKAIKRAWKESEE